MTMDMNVEDIVDRIFADDMKYFNNLIRSKKKLGLILVVIGTVIFLAPLGLVMYGLYMGPDSALAKQISSKTVFWVTFLLMFLGISFTRYGVALRREASRMLSPGAGRYTFYSKLECPKCGFIFIRERKPNEFVGDIVDEECDSCKQKMRVVGIYAEPEKKVSPIGYLMMPMAGQTTLMAIKAAIMNMLTPFKLAFRLERRRESKEKKKESKS